MPDELELSDEDMLTEQTLAEMQCGRAAIAKYAKRHDAALARRAAENAPIVPDEAAQAAAGAQRLDRNAPPIPAATVFPLAPEPYTPGVQASKAKR